MNNRRGFSLVTMQVVVIVLVGLLLGECEAAPNVAACDAGSYRSGATCVKCGPGTYNWVPYARSCSKCPRDSYTPFSGVVDSSLCLPCALDSYADPGSSACTRCPRGQVRSPKAAGPRCVACASADCACARTEAGCPSPTRAGNGCPGNLVQAPEGSSYWDAPTCVSPMTGCPQGLRLRAFVRRAVCERAADSKVVCPNNFQFDGFDRCLSCYPGSALQQVSGRLQCVRCVNGVSPGGTATSCTPCKPFWAPSADGKSCFNTLPPKQQTPPAGRRKPITKSKQQRRRRRQQQQEALRRRRLQQKRKQQQQQKKTV